MESHDNMIEDIDGIRDELHNYENNLNALLNKLQKYTFKELFK